MTLPMTFDREPGKRVEVESCPVRGYDRSVRGWVRVHTDRVLNRLSPTEFAICVDTTSFLSPFEARRFAQALEAAADRVEMYERQREAADAAS